jgi:pyruvate kinase
MRTHDDVLDPVCPVAWDPHVLAELIDELMAILTSCLEMEHAFEADLENLAKTGTPSRATITDAAMGERAECVMLNKGPHLVEAVRVLEDILRRMQAHENKKRAMLRPLQVSTMRR